MGVFTFYTYIYLFIYLFCVFCFVLIVVSSCCLSMHCVFPTDDLVTEKEKNKLLQEEMEATLHDIQNM